MQESVTLRVQRLRSSARLPVYSTADAACFDLFADIVGPTIIYTNMAHTIGTGLAVEVPTGWVMDVLSRSGHGFKCDVSLANSVGIIDADYRGEVFVRIRNDGTMPFTVRPGDKIVQARLLPSPRVLFEEVEALSETLRGKSRFGSTGR